MKRPGVLPLVAVLALWPLTGSAQLQGPSEVQFRAFLAPEEQTLRLVVRVPMDAMTGIEWPPDGSPFDAARAEPALVTAVTERVARRVDLYEGDRQLGAPRVAEVRLSLPSDTSFASYESALAHVTGPPLPADSDVVPRQALLDALLEYRIASPGSLFSIEPRFDTQAVRVSTSLTFRPSRGGERAFEFQGDPGLVRLEPRWFQAADRLAVDGAAHVFGRLDYLLFLFCLVMPFRQVRQVAAVAAAFVAASTIIVLTLPYDMAPDVLWFPPLIATLMAVSLVYVALENIVSPVLRRRVAMAFAFGVVHGFGLSFGLRDSLQLAGNHVLVSAVSFSAGVAVAQVAALATTLPVLALTFKYGVTARLGTIIISAVVTHEAWHWMLDRGTALVRYPVRLPVVDAAFLAFTLRWLTLAVSVAAMVWLFETMVVPRWRRT